MIFSTLSNYLSQTQLVIIKNKKCNINVYSSDLDSYMKELKIHKFLDEIC